VMLGSTVYMMVYPDGMTGVVCYQDDMVAGCGLM